MTKSVASTDEAEKCHQIGCTGPALSSPTRSLPHVVPSTAATNSHNTPYYPESGPRGSALSTSAVNASARLGGP